MSTLYNHRPHAFQLTGHDTPVLSPVRVSLELVPFDQSPSLHPLRDGWLSRHVRRLRGYYDSVRLPMFVHRQITSLDLLTRSARHLADKHRLSRFPREVSPYVHGLSDRAGLWCTSRYRCTRCCLPLSPTASASRSEFLTRLNTRPARSPVNASTPPSRAAPHDSGSMWVAKPLSYDFFIHYNLAGLTGAQEKRNENQSDQHIRGRPEQGPALLYGGTGLCQED